MNTAQRMLRRMLIVTTAYPLFTLFIAVLLAVAAIFYTIENLDFQTSQKDLISPENRLVKLSEKIDQFDDLDTFVVAIENRDRARSLQFLHALAKRLEADKQHYLQVFYQVDTKAVRPWALLYLDRDELLDLYDKIAEHKDFISQLSSNPGLVNFFDQINREMASRMVGELFTGFLDEPSSGDKKKPFDLSFLITILKQMGDQIDSAHSGKSPAPAVSPWNSFFKGGAWSDDSDDSYFWTENKRYLLLFVTPQKKDHGFSKAYHSLLALRDEIKQVKSGFPDIDVGVTGQEALNQDEMGVAMHDMSIATVISLLSLLGLLVLFWKGFRRPLLEISELLLALSWTFGLTTLFIGHLNILSITFAPLLLGLGIDYGIHWFARYQEIENKGATSEKEAVMETMTYLGPGILLAGATAALSFFPLVLTGFKGLVELGIIATMGMLMTTVTTLCVLPSLTLLFDRFNKKRQLASTQPKTFLKLNNRLAMVIVVPAGFLLLISIWQAQKVSFDLNMLNLQSNKAESVVWEKKLLADSKRSSMYGAVLASSLEETRKKAAALKALPTVSEVRSVQDLLPEHQREKMDILRKIKPLLPSQRFLAVPSKSIDLARLDDVLGRIHFKMLDSEATKWGADKPLETQMLEVRRLISKLRRSFITIDKSTVMSALKSYERTLVTDLNDKLDILYKNVNTRPMRLDDLPQSLLDRFVSKDNLYLIRVFPAQDIWEPKLLGRFVRDMRTVDPDVIGDPVTLYVFTKAFRNACIKAVIYAMVFVVILIFATFRKMVDTGLVLMPLVVGTIWTLGFMGILGIDFNLANTIFLPLVVGAGVEYGIIIMQRFRQEENYVGELQVPYSTAKGIILAGLTTTVGFGSLTISSHQGIHSLGMLAMVGSLSILAASVFFLPALVQLLLGSPRLLKWRHPTKHLSVEQD